MNKKTKYFSFAIAIIAVATVMTIAIYAATTASAVMSASVSWTATAGIEFELEAWAVNNASQNGIGNTTVPRSITKQVVTTATTNQSASGLGGDLSCNFYDGTNDGVNNPSSIIFTYKITNTGDTVILIKATKTPNTASESGSTAADHKPAVALSTEIDGVVKGGAVSKVIGSEGYKIQPNSTFEYIVILSIASADIDVQNFDAGVTFSMAVSSGVTTLELSREEILYAQNSQIVSGTTSSGTSTTFTYFGAYPQTFVGASLNSTLKSALEAGTLEASGYSYNIITEDWFMSDIITIQEYFYQNNYYACLEQGNPESTSYKFSTGETIVSGEKYFFKVEPLKWTNHNGIYLCSQVIDNYEISYSYSVEWKDSYARSMLNNYFYEESGLNLIKTTKSIVQNNTAAGELTDGAGTPTEDYIWLPSYQEMNTWFSSNEERNVAVSDLAKATYCDVNRYWLRTASGEVSDHGEKYCYLIYNGKFGVNMVDSFSNGIRPCFAL